MASARSPVGDDILTNSQSSIAAFEPRPPTYEDHGDFKDSEAKTYTVGALEASPNEILDVDLSKLRKVSVPMPWPAMLMCLIELAERASYYGCYYVFNNFINNPLPKGGNGAGAVAKGSAGSEETAGALGMGSVDASALTNLFTFLAYVVPIYGAIVADTKWGRFKTICVGTGVGILSHWLLVIPAIPAIIAKPSGSMAAFVISIIILAFASGFIKPSLGPLLCDQIPIDKPTLKVLKSGECVVLDPSTTVSRWLLIFYACINIGALFSIATEYAERYVGYWLAFFLPGIIYMCMPIVLIICYKRLYKAPPQGSVLVETFKVFKILLQNGGWKKMWKGGESFWQLAKPSYIIAHGGDIELSRIFWDDKFVDEVKQSIHACQVFALLPIYTLADGGIGNSLNDMSDAMVLKGAPNDLIGNFNSISIIIFAPILSHGLYPFMERIGHPLKPMTRMSIGFILATIGCITSALVQWQVYQTSPCGNYATTCDEVSKVSLWWQILIYVFPGVGELFVYVTSYEIAYTCAPARMKGLIFAMSLFVNAIGAAVSLALSGVIKDPYLVWPWVALAVACFCCSLCFPTFFSHLNNPLEDFANRNRKEGLNQPSISTGFQEKDQSKA